MPKRADSIVEGIADRTLPHSLEAERSVLGAILLHNDAYVAAATIVREEDFFRDAHRRIYRALRRLLDRPAGAADLVTLLNELGHAGEVDEVGGPSYIAALVDGVPRSTNVEHYAHIVAEKSLLRRMVFAGNKLLTNAYAGEESAREILRQHDNAVLDMQRNSHTKLRRTSESTTELIEDLEYYAQHPGELRGVTTGFEQLDELTMGLQPGVIVVAARPSIGKTTLVLNLVQACCASRRKDGSRRHAFICTFEQKRKPLEMRMLSAISGVHHKTLRGGWVSTDESWRAVSEALVTLKEMDIAIDDDSEMVIDDIRANARQLMADGGLDLVVIDYIQLMEEPATQRNMNRTEQLTKISRRLKKLSDELNVPVIVVSQL